MIILQKKDYQHMSRTLTTTLPQNNAAILSHLSGKLPMSAPLNKQKKSSNKRNRVKPLRIFNVWKRKKEKSIRFYVRTQRWSWAELQYAWCDWQPGLKLFIIQYGWLSDEAKGREREWEQKKSRWRYGAFCSALAGWKCEFFSSLLY